LEFSEPPFQHYQKQQSGIPNIGNKALSRKAAAQASKVNKGGAGDNDAHMK